MHRSIILWAVVAASGMFGSRAFAQAITFTSTRSASITLHGVTESKSPYPQGNPNFSQTVQDSYNDGTGSPFGIDDMALSQQTSSISYGDTSQTLDVSVGGTIGFHMVGEDYVQTASSGLVTFTLDSPATFSLTENSDLEGGYLGGDGEVFFAGGTLVAGTAPVSFYQPNLIPYIWQLAQQQGGGILTYNGSLAAGTYTYFVGAEGNGTDHEGGSLTFTSDFQVSEVPEPLVLPLLGIAALAMLRRRPLHG